MTDGEPETAVSASLQKIKSIKNQHKKNSSIFSFIKSQTSDSFVNHFDGHFAYLKTLDFYFKMSSDERHANVSLIVRDKVTRQCPQTTTFEEKEKPKRIRTEVPLLTSLTLYR